MNVEILYDVPVSQNFSAHDSRICCAYPLTTMCQNGTVAIAYRCGTSKHSYDGELVMQVSTDNGKTWDSARTIFCGADQIPRQTIIMGGLVQARPGTLIAVFGTIEGLNPDVYMFSEKGSSLPLKIFTSRSVDLGKSWSTAELVNLNGLQRPSIVTSPFLLEDKICMPLEFLTESGVQGTAVAFSTDNGKTFPKYTIVADDHSGCLNLCDGRWTLLPDDRIQVLLWTFRKDDEKTLEVRQTFSTDKGCTWAQPQCTGFKGQVSAPIALPTGNIIAVSNSRCQPAGIRLWASSTGGENWNKDQYIQMWDPGDERIKAKKQKINDENINETGVWDELQRFSFGTPDLVLLKDGTILMSYYATIKGITHIRACRFHFN